MQKILSQINFFKIPVRLKINGLDFYSSRPGEFISLVILGILLYMLITHDVFYKRNPITFEKSLKTQKFPLFQMNQDNFFIAVKLTLVGGVGVEYDPRIYSFQVGYLTSVAFATGYNIQNYSLVEMVLCSKSEYRNNTKYKKMLEMHPTLMCLPKPVFEIEGSFSQIKVSKFSINLQKCKNSTSNNNSCRSAEQINTFLKGTVLGYTYLDRQIDLEDFDNLILESTSALYKTVEVTLRKRLFFYIDIVEIESDVGLIWVEKENINTWMVGSCIEDFDFSPDEAIIELHFYSSDIVRTYIRRYKKIQDAMASLGGILNFLVLSSLALLKLIPFTSIEHILSNKLYSYKQNFRNKIPINLRRDKKKKGSNYSVTERKISQLPFLPSSPTSNYMIPSFYNSTRSLSKSIRSPKNIKIISHSGDNSISDISDADKILEDFGKKITKLTIPKSKVNRPRPSGQLKKSEMIASFIKSKEKLNSLEFKMTELFRKASRANLKKKLSLINKANRKIGEQLDIIRILEKLHEIDKLKFLLFNPQQLLILQLISKPLVLLDERNEKSGKKIGTGQKSINARVKSLRNGGFQPLELEEVSDEEIDEMVLYFNEMQRKEEGGIDERLMMLLDDDVKNLLEQQVGTGHIENKGTDNTNPTEI